MRKSIRNLLFIFIAVGLSLAYFGYRAVYSDWVPEEGAPFELYIDPGDSRQEVFDALARMGVPADDRILTLIADRMQYRQPKPGRYLIRSGWSRYKLLQVLRAGEQVPVDVVVNNVRTIEDLAVSLAEQLAPPVDSFTRHLRDHPSLHEKNLGDEQALSLIIPNTYEFFWTTSAHDFVYRMEKEHRDFWNDKRMREAEAIGLLPWQVYTLASIVEKETNRGEEKSTIAGVYLNRLERGMPLQADPTIVFATGNFGLRRILHKHLEIDSPYNTYRNKGLPPGPICMPSIESIDAVLQVEDHDYLFFCARPDNSGLHAFASTLRQHNQNARKFHAWLNQNGVK